MDTVHIHVKPVMQTKTFRVTQDVTGSKGRITP